MGYTKRLIEHYGDCSPGAYEDHHVCSSCFDDLGLEKFIYENLEARDCSFCHNTSEKPIAVSFVNVLLYMNQCLRREYSTAEAELPYEGNEGGFIGEVIDTQEILLSHVNLPIDESGELFDALCDGLGNRNWCRKNPFSLAADERLNFSWDALSELVKYHRRFFFLSAESEDDELYSTSDFFSELQRWCGVFSLIRALPAGSKLYRGRFQESSGEFKTAKELGPPPRQKALMSNRMSPAGIVMFYLSEDPETALRETTNNPGQFVIAEFEILRDISILDLARIPRVPSIFESVPDSLEFNPRPPTMFLNYFAVDLSKPIERDHRSHIEYIPTQVITEYFRTWRHHGGAVLDGIRYRSARHNGKSSLVLFATQDDLVDGQKNNGMRIIDDSSPWIKLTGISERDVTTTQWDRWKHE